MHSLETWLSLCALLCWVGVLLLPWQPWRVREVLEASAAADPDYDLQDVSVVIPARNEAEVIAETLSGLKLQGQGLKIIVVDDDSDDDTAAIVKNAGIEGLQLIESKSLPAGWSGKLWAQEQGVQHVNSRLVLLLDADIKLLPGMLKSLKQKYLAEDVQFVSLMAELRFSSFWEKMMMPAFIYFFKLLYPFALANNKSSKIAAAAGGCILLETEALHRIGGMQSIKDALIDDCTLAKTVKQQGYSIWVGLTHGVISQRPYDGLSEIWQMVARTAFTQLYYSTLLLFACTAIMLLMFWWPFVGLYLVDLSSLKFNLIALLLLLFLYQPTLRYYRLNGLWALSLPLIAGLYLMMTWTSALRYWKGERSRWKGRTYKTEV